MAKKAMSAMAPVVTVGGTEEMLVLDGTTPKTLTAALMAAYANDVIVAAAAAMISSSRTRPMGSGANRAISAAQ